eukprot:CAMPEP_0195519654 /NCGR_PEP_ID=MMETSP0794_2-20130614/15215_1 /TAXON_ID=515487 /ORGANISM="Stephanopyxis turris, Strain CCMP 815" /LENGTH=288 /DNA_ID=CAMNT_0040648845 /DNA_START=116 /DNA_END=982 /DNA_ORIENTATION=-
MQLSLNIFIAVVLALFLGSRNRPRKTIGFASAFQTRATVPSPSSLALRHSLSFSKPASLMISIQSQPHSHGGSPGPTILHVPFGARTTTPLLVRLAATASSECPVSRVSVCAGELCQCQGEEYEYTGGAADAAIEELQERDLAFPIDRVGCLGACGIGTMILIDYENGDATITAGLEETLVELGIEGKERLENIIDTRTDNTEAQGMQNMDSAGPLLQTATGIVESSKKITASLSETSKAPFAKPPLLADTRERMREESASEDEEVENPWIKMASYLGKKVTNKMFGK